MSKMVVALAITAVIGGDLAAQTEQRSVRGPAVAIYNLVGRVRAVAGTGDAVAIEITRGGPDAGQLKVATGSIGGRETLRIVYPSDRVVYSGGP